jgi:hypothetical protein
MAQAQSMSREIISALDRKTLEAALFAAAATLRGIGKGELPPPPKQANRTAITVGLIKMGRLLIEADGATEEKDVPVTDVGQAADILKQIASGGSQE